jgi:hypothetical protein
MSRRAKSCGKGGPKTPLEIASRFPLFAQLQQQQAMTRTMGDLEKTLLQPSKEDFLSSGAIKLDDRDHFLENPFANVASLRRLITLTLEC